MHRFPATAVRIEFDSFSLGSEFERTYSIRGLPKLNYEYRVGLAVDYSDAAADWPPKELGQLRGDLEIKILDSDGEVIVKAHESVGKLRWSKLKGDSVFGFVNASEKANPDFGYGDVKPGKVFDRLVIAYRADAGNSDLRARVRIMSDSRQDF
jgi:hypothetical protein